uniref:NADH-ubiquinone oxidoreductase chain 6 n=1 Tax=Coleoptera sp. 27 KM-2017 TaxID=2219331 RepID=A0A346RKB6_9COLE|nr:NADH dehydrogenase subunit 6 [Coleoptera sp. 27 KM-2017]
MILMWMMMLLLSFFMIFMNHPISMSIILLIQTILIALITGLMKFNFWYSYILFLIMIGGLLILFMYMTSIASNEKFKFSMNLMLILIPSLMLIMMNFIMPSKYNFSQYQESITQMNSMNIDLNKFMNYPFNMIMIMMIIYLFLALIMAVKITNIKMGTLRKKF